MAQYGVSRPDPARSVPGARIGGLDQYPARLTRRRAGPHAERRRAARYAGLVLQYRGVTLPDVHEARLVLEPPAAAMLASRRTKKTITALEKALAAAAASVDDPLEFARTSAHFHEQVLELAGNQTARGLRGHARIDRRAPPSRGDEGSERHRPAHGHG